MKGNLLGKLLSVIADLIRNPVHPTAWMPPDRSPGQAPHVRHDDACAAVTVPMNKAWRSWHIVRVGKPLLIRESTLC